MCWVQPEPALRGTRSEALAYAREHEVHTLASYIDDDARVAARCGAGEWDEAERAARGELERGSTVAAARSRKTVLAELAVRRGDADAAERLADLAAQADRAGEPAAAGAGARARDRVGADERRADADRAHRACSSRSTSRGAAQRLGRARVAAWAAVAGLEVELGRRPRAVAVRRDGARATGRRRPTRFGEVGWSYDRALMLSLLDDEESLVEAIEIARALGAEPLDAARRRADARARAERPARAARVDAREPGRA